MDLNIEVDALIQARQLSIDQIETLSRVFFGKDPSLVSTAELKRDLLIYAKRYPEDFLNTLNAHQMRQIILNIMIW